MSYNPFGNNNNGSIVSSLVGQTGHAFSTVEGADVHAGDGLSAIRFAVSVGDGRGATRVDLTGDHVDGVLDALSSFRLDQRQEDMSPGEVIARTIRVEGDTVQFLVSGKKNARTVTIPVKEWDAFIQYMEGVSQWTRGAVNHYRAVK